MTRSELKELVYALLYSAEHEGTTRFTQSAPILAEVWLSLLDRQTGQSNITALLTPTSTDGVGKLRRALELAMKDRRDWHIAQNDSHLSVEINADDLYLLVMLTSWWNSLLDGWGDTQGSDGLDGRGSLREEQTNQLRSVVTRVDANKLADKLVRIVDTDSNVTQLKALLLHYLVDEHDISLSKAQRRILLQVLVLVSMNALIATWLTLSKSDIPIANEQLQSLLRSVLTEELGSFNRAMQGHPLLDEARREYSGCLWSVTADRKVEHAVYVSRKTIKADAGSRVFDQSCKEICWAVIDSGIDATHPAFQDRTLSFPAGIQRSIADIVKGSRIVKTLDFTYLRDLTRGNIPKNVFSALDPEEQAVLTDNARSIAENLRLGHMLDWSQLEPLLTVAPEAYVQPNVDVLGHGTHVAGILGACWPTAEQNGAGVASSEAEESDITGVCPDIKLMDLRIFNSDGSADEFTVLGALQYVRYLNQSRGKYNVHGVNLSLSLHHDVRNYGCGATPVCIECDRLVGSGVVVVAAAGNYGYEKTAASFNFGGSFRGMTITDPGNAEAVITVGATHRRDPHLYGISYFSSRGPTGDGRHKPDIVAPGERIVSVIPDCDLDERDGTSMAAPHVSGVAAMLLARNPELIGRPRRIKEILCSTATDLGREPIFQGAGLVDALRALQAV